jgi:hypothetical protein
LSRSRPMSKSGTAFALTTGSAVASINSAG